MSFDLHQLEMLYSECIRLPENERAIFIAKQVKGNKLLEETVLSLIADRKNADIYFRKLQRIYDSLDPDTHE